MSSAAAERRQVYLACKAIFSGTNALMRRSKAIQKRVTEHEASLQTLILDFDVDRVTKILKGLLEKKVFQSEIKAKLEFPDLFVSAPSRETQHDAFEDEAARSAAEVLEEIASVYEREDRETTPVPPATLAPEMEIATEVQLLAKEEYAPGM
jgi:hypothetical protein